METPTQQLQGWQKALAPNLIGLFLWIGFLDQIPRETIGRSSLAWPVLGVSIGSILSYLLLFRTPALWTQRSGHPFSVVATSTFGIRGATWVPGLLVASVQVVWIALAIRYGTLLTLRGLELLGLLDPSYHEKIAIGRFALPGGLFTATSFFIGFATTVAGRYLVRVIAALMTVYPIVLAILLGLTATLAMRGLPDYKVITGGLSGGNNPGILVTFIAIQMVFAFACSATLSAADWGAASGSARDVKFGGWVGMTLAPAVIASLSILTVAGTFVRYGIDVPVTLGKSSSLIFIHAVESLTGGRIAGAMFLAIGLAALAPGCFSAYILGVRFHDAMPNFSQTGWTLIGFLVAWLMVVAGLVDRTYPVLGVVGALLAPILGAVAADATRTRGEWAGPRNGLNWPGLVAWIAGLGVALVPLSFVTRRIGIFQPAAIISFAVAFLTYHLVALVVGESRLEPGFESIEAKLPAPTS